MRDKLPWFIMSLFVVQGIFGMIPAIFTDVNPKWNRCDFAQSQALSPKWFTTVQVLLSTLIPYIIPFILLLYPLIYLTKVLSDVDDPGVKNSTKIIVVVGWTYITLT